MGKARKGAVRAAGTGDARSAGRWVAVAAVAACAVACALGLAGCGPQAVVDEGSPRMGSATIGAGSALTEESQYVEVRVAFDAPVKAAGSVLDDVDVLVDGGEPDAQTMAVSAVAEGSELVVRLEPTAAADGSSSTVYFALYDGLVQVVPRDEGGALPHVTSADGKSNAVMEPLTFTVPTGFLVSDVEAVPGDADSGTPASVDFTVAQFAQLRCCTWFDFGTGPLFLHNHEFLRDLPSTAAMRLAQTVNARSLGALTATSSGARVHVEATSAVSGQMLGVEVLEGRDVDPRAEGAFGPADEGLGTGAAMGSAAAEGAGL